MRNWPSDYMAVIIKNPPGPELTHRHIGDNLLT
jgi:hypothetical protein